MPPVLPSPPFALFDNNLDADGTSGAWLLTDLREEVVVRADGDWRAALDRVDAAARAGAWVTLAATYELGEAIEPRLRRPAAAPGAPVLQAWIFARAEWLDDDACDAFLAALADEEPAACTPLRPTLDAPIYTRAIERIRRYIEEGDCYQVNFTFPLHGQLIGSPAALYRQLRRAQPVRHGAYIVHRDGVILSRSPELFLERNGLCLASEPMKGTAPRSSDPQRLASSAKDRAENVMIVDLLRNDLGRLVPPGGVRVEALCRLDAYPTVWQMSSRIVAEPVHAGLGDIFSALFPCGSITGAPKIRAMEIIRTLEDGPRGLYCGALGWIRPGGDFRFSVPIRTARVAPDGALRLDVGSGIVHDSRPDAEWQECHLKARFLTDLPTDLRLIETLRLEPDGAHRVPFLTEHLERLSSSATALGFAFDATAFRRLLDGVQADSALRIRITLGRTGDLTLETAPLTSGAPGPAPTICLAPDPVRSNDPRLRHKTTARQRYDRALARALADGHFDTLFRNERGELTEGARSNLFILRNGELLTPPLACGLLNGVLRRRLIHTGEAREAVLTLDDLRRADAVFMGNGLRGRVQVGLADT